VAELDAAAEPDGRASDARYQSLLRSATTDVWWADADGKLLGDLPAWRRHTGQVVEDLLGAGWLDAVRHDQRTRVAGAWQAAVAAGEAFEAEFPVVSTAGVERVVTVRAHRLLHPEPAAADGSNRQEWLGTVTLLDGRAASELWLDARTAETLHRISTALVSELDLERVVQHVTEAATELTGAQYGSFFYNIVDDTAVEEAAADGAGAESYMLYTLCGAPREAFDGFPMPRNTALFEPTFRGEGVIRLDDVTEDPRYGQNPPYHGMPPGHLPVRSYLAVPVVSRSGQVLGGLFFGHSEPGVFTAQHVRLVQGVAAPAAIAIDNARLFEAAERERAKAQRLAERLSRMQDVSARLAGARIVDQVAEVVVSDAAAALRAQRAVLYLVEDDGETLELVRSSGIDPRLVERWDMIGRRADVPATDALRTRRTVFVGGGGRDGPDDDTLAAVPLLLGDNIFGVAVFGWDEPRRLAEEVPLLEALAGQCAQALERARLYEVERQTARTLQRSLLPPRAPEIPGMEVAAVYRAGDRSVAVGGDFYDVFRLDVNRWGIAMGDVCGRGAQAAARTALVRYTLRAIAASGEGPADALRRLNTAVVAEPDADDRFYATVFGHVELDRCGAWVTLACAGHPRPVVVRRAGWIDLRGQPGSLIGLFDEVDVSPDRVGLGPGDSLVFFTDGITEARNSEGEQFGDEALPETLLASTHVDARTLAERVRRAAVEFCGARLDDDIAILVVRVPPDADDDPDARIGAALGRDAATGLPNYPLPHGGQTERPRPPREARIVLPPHPSSPRAARRFLAALLTSWRMPEMLEGDAALLLSELATNAVLHARSPFTVIARFDGAHLILEVGDGSQAQPRLGIRDDRGTPGGRGLMLIDTISSRWGILRTTNGKRVWFELPVPPPRR
jgi:serine phosphatase RsbU (regulator of sigma subunit)/anti-sigma regulatory factor (Ser/Thr protein kinase)